MTDLDDVLKERLDRLKADRDRTKAAFDVSKSRHGAEIRIDPALIESFGRTMLENLTGSTPFRKAYLRSLINVVEVNDAQIRIKSSRDVLEMAVRGCPRVPPENVNPSRRSNQRLCPRRVPTRFQSLVPEVKLDLSI